MVHPGRQSVVLLLALWSRPLVGQRWAVDSSVQRLVWGSVDVLVRADSTAGVRLWAQTSSLGHTGAPLAFIASFDPDSAIDWLAQAHRVATYANPPSDSSVEALETRPLCARDGSQLVLVRLRRKGRWADHASLLFLDASQRHPWSIDAKLDEADRFLQVFFNQASRSGVRHDSTFVREANPLAEGTCPAPLPGNPVPRYPAGLDGQAGAVWMTFVVRRDGGPDPTSFRAVLFDHPAFADAVYDALRSSRYTPGTLNGRPVPMLVSQRVVFKIR